MSSEFTVRTGGPPPRAVIDPGIQELRWRGDQPPDPLEPGAWELYLEGVSTRVTTVACEPGALTVTIRSGASFEDCELALGIVRRCAALGEGKVDTGDAGELSLDQLDQWFGADWQRGQLESAARISIHLARERGPIAMPGPTRSVWVGERVSRELEDGHDATVAERLVAVMRRVLWPDPRYEAAAEFTVSDPGGDSFTLAMLLPERPCVLPRTDQLAIAAGEEPFLIPWPALAELPVRSTWLDDGNQLVEGVAEERWADLCRAALRHRPDGS